MIVPSPEALRTWVCGQVPAGAALVAVKAHFGYPLPPPATLEIDVFEAILSGVRDAAPACRLMALEGVTGEERAQAVFDKLGASGAALRHGAELFDADTLPLRTFENTLEPEAFDFLVAPQVLADADVVFVATPLKLALSWVLVGAWKSMFGVLPRQVYAEENPNYRSKLHTAGIRATLHDLAGCLGGLNLKGVIDARKVLCCLPETSTLGVAVKGPGIIAADSLSDADAEASALGVELCRAQAP